MRRTRALLSYVALALVLAQGAGAALSIAACCQEMPATQEMDCCRGGDNGHICPINKGGGDTRCRMRAACDPETAGLLPAVWHGEIPLPASLAPVLTAAAVPVAAPGADGAFVQPPPTPPPQG